MMKLGTRTTRPRRLILIAVATCAATIAGCAASDRPSEQENGSKPVVYTAEDKRIARLLSIGNRQDLLVGSAYDKAQLCSVAIETIEDQMRKSDVLSAQQLRAVALARTAFDRQALALGRAEGKSADRVIADRRALIQDDLKRQERMQLSLSCLEQARQIVARPATQPG